jgi:hypothetical protein
VSRPYVAGGLLGAFAVVVALAAYDCGKDAGRYERARVLCGLVGGAP